ncbi:Pyridoxal-phosphate dependent enzyme family protein [Aphelenchoides avenae]|nr:Pyridoxal-phosphate dependent enzyme family protein [Aphelenchus avenae]
MSEFLFGGGIKKLVRKEGGFYMNQFANAEKAEEFHESDAVDLAPPRVKEMMEALKNLSFESTNLMHEIVAQLREALNAEAYVYPDFFVHSAGTGGSISSVGRYVKKYDLPTQVVLADAQFSIYYDYVVHDDFKDRATERVLPGIEGTAGFQPARFSDTTSLQRNVVDRAIKVPDLASTAALWVMKDVDEEKLACGPTTGLAFVAALSVAAKEKHDFSES